MAVNPLQQLFGMMGNSNGNMGMNPQMLMSMLQQMMSGKLNPQQAINQMGGQIQNLSLDDYNKQVLAMATQFNQMYGDKDGSLTSIILNSKLTVGQFKEAIELYKQIKGIN